MTKSSHFLRFLFSSVFIFAIGLTASAANVDVPVVVSVGESVYAQPSVDASSSAGDWTTKTEPSTTYAKAYNYAVKSTKRPKIGVTGVKAGSTSCVLRKDSSTTCTFNITVIAKPTDCGEVHISLDNMCVLTNSSKQAIHYNDITGCVEEDSGVATVVAVDIGGTKYAAVKNTLRDGQADVTVGTAGGSYLFHVDAITIKIEKTVETAVEKTGDQHLWSNATVRVVTHVLNNRKPTPPNVLFLGSMCSAHTLSAYTLGSSINAIASLANVDWYLKNKTSYSSYDMSGSDKYGEEVFTVTSSSAKNNKTGSSITMHSSNHQALGQFIKQIASSFDEKGTNYYDYIVMEFDGSRLFPSYSADATAEAKVAEYLKPYYKAGRVIWVVDPDDDDEAEDWDFSDGDNTYYRPHSYASSEYADDAEYRGIVALLDPEHYVKNGTRDQLKTAKDNNDSKHYGNTRNPNQMYYKDCGKLVDYLKASIKPIVYDTELTDTIIKVSDTMNIAPGSDSVRVYSIPLQPGEQPSTSIMADDPRWVPATEPATVSDHTVKLQVNGITNECWRKVEIDIRAEKDFLDKAVAYKTAHPDWAGLTWNSTLGVWEVNPNEGDALISLWRVDGESRVQCSAAAQAATILWKYWGPPIDVTSSDVSKVYDGKATNVVVVTNPEDTTIKYRKVGETTWKDYDPTTGFTDVADSGDVELWISRENYQNAYVTNKVTITAAPVKEVGPSDPSDPSMPAPPTDGSAWAGATNIVKTYDGLGTNITAVYGGFKPNSSKVTVRYSLDKKTWGPWSSVSLTNVCTATEVFFTVTDANYNVLTNSAYVTIRAGGMTIGPGKGPADEPVTHPPAPEAPIPLADPEKEYTWTNGARSVTKTYDGKATNIIVRVDNPSTAVVRYSYDGTNFVDASAFKGYTTVTNLAPVWYEASDPAGNFRAITNRAFVTIERKNLGGGGGGDPDENSIVADDKSMPYGKSLPTLTWHGGKGLAEGDTVKDVQLALTNNVDATKLPKGVYPNLISTNAAVEQAIVITNSVGVNVTDCYSGFFTPGKLTVVAGGMEIGPEGPAVYPPQGEEPLPPAEPGDDPRKTGARSVTKTYDGKATNIVVTTIKPSDGVVRYSYDGTNFVDASAFKGYTTVTNLAPVWFEVTDPHGNYQAITNRAFVTIERKDLGGGGGGDPDENSIVADDKSMPYGKSLPTLTWHGGKGLAEGDTVKDVQLALTNAVVASTLPKGVYPNLISTNAAVEQAIVITNSVGVNVTDCYSGFFTPGKLTVVAGGMEIGPEGPAVYPPQGEDPLPPAKPGDDPTKTGARSVTKTYDGRATNIVVTTIKPSDGVVRYSYDGTNFVDASAFKGYTTVTNLAPVWFEVTDPHGNYQAITNRAFVTIDRKNLGGGGGGDPDENSIVADDKSIAYGDACPTLTWHGGKGLAPGDSIQTVSLALKDGKIASKLPAGVYPGMIATNAAVVIVNPAGENVTDCYEGFFTPGTFTVTSAAIRHEVEVPNVPYDGKGTNITVKLISKSDPPFVLKYRGSDTPEGVWLDEPPVYTNAGPYDITYVIEDGENFTPVTNTVTMIISRRKITLKSPNKEKIYDMNPLKLLADEIAAGGMGFADGERFDFTDLAEIKLPGTVKATFTYGDGTAVLANYEVTEVKYGTLRVNPNDDQILVRSASGSWTYDGAAHGTNDFVVVGEKNLYDGDWVLAELKGNTVTTPDEGDITNAFKTVEIYRGPKGDVARSTKVTSEYVGKLLRDEGLLNVVNAKFADPVVSAYRGLYDGLDHGIIVEKPTVPGGGTADVDYPDGNLFRDATNAVVRFVISAPYYDDYVGESTVEILPREIVFTTGDDTKKYGTAAVTPSDIKVEGDGFVGNENYQVAELDKRIEVGRSDAGFEYSLINGAKPANYTISMDKGALTVYDDKKLTVIATNSVHVFDGTEYYNHAVTVENLPADCTVTPVFAASSVITYPGEVANRIAAVKILKGTVDVTTDYEAVLIDGKLKVVAAKLAGGEVVSTNVVYDGKGHSIVVTPPTFKGTGPARIEYSTTGWDGPYQSENPSFTLADPNGTPNEVYVRISVPGYEDYYTNGYVTVTRRPVTIASDSAEKTYDGMPLSNNVVNVSSTVKLADGDVLVAGTTASQTSAGQTDNAFDYKIMDEATRSIERTKNYHVTIDNGVLTVNPASIPPWNPEDPSGPEPEGPWVWIEDATMVYTGEAGTNVAVTSGHFADGLPKLEYRPEGTLKFLPFAQVFTNVMYDAEGNYRSTNVTVRFTGDSNYLSTNLTAKVTILPGSIKLGPDGPVTYPPAGQPPMPEADPNDPNSWTNGARSVRKTYDGLPTNIVVTADTPADAKITYSFDKTDWKSYESFPGYTEVTNTATVWFKVEALNYQTVTNRAFVTIEPKSLGPKLDPHPKDPKHPYVPEEGIVIPDLPSDIYDGDPYEPAPAVTNTLVKGVPPELEEGKDYTIEYFNNTNATEEAYVVITGIGNYGGCYTNYFTILPRQVTLKSGTKEMYLAEPPTTVVCSNFSVWVEKGSFVTNAITGREDGFVPTVTNVLVSAVPAGPVVNDFTVQADPAAFATNYSFTLQFGHLAIYSSPTNRHGETHEEVPSVYGGVVDAVMDNNDAGPYAADKPKEFNDEAAKLVKDPMDKVEFRMILSTNYVEASYVSVSNKIVDQAFEEGHAKGWDDKRIQHEIDKYGYDIFDIAVQKIHAHCDSEGEVLNVETNDWGNSVSQLLTVRIPYAFSPKLIDFSVWRNHTNDSGGVTHDGVTKLPYYGTVTASQESWETNATEVVLRVQKFSVYVFKSVYLSTPRLTGRMRWKYHRAESTFYAGLDVACTNGDKEVISDLCYIFEDRTDWYLRNPTPKDRSHLSDSSYVDYGGKRFAKVPLSGVQAQLRANELCTTSHYGVAESTFSGAEYGSRYVVPTLEERKIALTTTKVKELATTGTSPEVNQMLGYLTWKEEGYDEVFWCALGEGMEPLNTAALKLGASSYPPLTLAQANALRNAMQNYGVIPLTPDSEPTLEIASFKVEGGVISGRVQTTNGVDTGVPGSKAQLEILGASSLGGDFTVVVATPKLEADGSFEFAQPAGVNFFRARLSFAEGEEIK